MNDYELFVRPDGTIETIYNDEVLDLMPVESGVRHTVTRASHVEPCPAGGWTADMAPVGGKVLGPFPTRALALSAEVDWLAARLDLGRL